jgi:hypothetical protein
VAKATEITVRISDLREFQGFVAAAVGVVRAYDAARDGDPGTALGVAIEEMRSAMLDLAEDDA